MRNAANAKYVKAGITLGAVVAFGMLCALVLAHVGAIGSFCAKIGRILMPFVYGAVIAYILSPVANTVSDFCERHIPKLGKATGAVSIVSAIVFALAILAAFAMLVVPSVADSVVKIVRVVPSQMETASTWFATLLEESPELQEQYEELSGEIMDYITSWMQTDLLTTVQTLATSFSGQIAGVVTVLANLFLGMLISVYLLAGRKRFARQARLILYGVFRPGWAASIEREVRYADKMLSGFLLGRIIDSAIIGVVCFIFCAIMGFDSAALIAVIVGVMNVIPVFGPYLGAIPCALLLLLENPVHCIIFVIFIIVLQVIDGNVLGPRILGETTGVGSFWVLFAVLVFGGLWGIVGMIVGVPLFAVIYDIAKRLVIAGLAHHGQTDMLEKGLAEGSVTPPDSDGIEIGG